MVCFRGHRGTSSPFLYNQKLYQIHGVPLRQVIIMKGFRVTGSFADARQGQQPFSVEVAADNEAAAKEQIVSTMGSRHKVKRWQITVNEISEISNDQIENPVVKYKVTGE